MRRNLMTVAAVAAVALASCTKEQGAGRPNASVPAGDPCEVSVSIRGTAGTRAVDVKYADEARVNNLQVFVFRGEDLEAHRSVDNSMTALIPATSGERTVWAVVNAPDLYAALGDTESSPFTLSRFKSAMSALSDNASGSFVMTGVVTQELVDGGNVIVTVKRIVSRVSIGKISASMKDYREPYTVRVEKIYMVNVAGDVSYDQSVSAGTWVNQLKHADASYDALLFDDITADGVIVKNNEYTKDGVSIRETEAYTPESIAHGQYVLAEGVVMERDNSYTREHVFYPYPNVYGTDDGRPANHEETWSPRGSILVIEASLITDKDEDGDGVPDEVHGYYPIELPVLQRNRTYSIDEVRITRLPGEDPFKPIETGESQVTVSVADWELGLNLGTVNI